MTRLFILFAFISNVCMASEPKFQYPVIVTTGASMNDFIPQGWTAIDTAYGHINNDQSTDIAFVIQYKERVPEYFIIDQGDTVMEDAQPRVLVVILKDKVSGHYSLALQNNNFILRAPEGTKVDPLYQLSLAGGNLNIGFMGGNSDKWKLNYKFRYDAGEWHLIQSENLAIGFDEKTEKWDFDFVSGKANRATGTIANDQERIETVSLNFKELKTFKTLIRPLTWKVFEDVYL